MSTIHVTIDGQERLVRDLRSLGNRNALKTVARRATTIAMRPTIAAARALAPEASGRLRASIGQLATSSRGGLFVGSRVGVRRDFVYTANVDKSAKHFTGERRVVGRGKNTADLIAKGFSHDKVAPQQYARSMHFGVDSKGRTKRRAGGIPFLDDAILRNAGQIIATVESHLRGYIERTAAGGGTPGPDVGGDSASVGGRAFRKLTSGDVNQIRSMAGTSSRAALARRFGVSRSHIGSVIRRTSHRNA
jgi:hypothetical protein